MSAFVVANEHINVLLYAGLQESQHGALMWEWSNLQAELTHDTADRVGQMLLDENCRSVDHFFGNEPDDMVAYTYHPPHHTTWSDGEILMAVTCLEDQSCETPDWRGTEAFAFCDALRDRIICGLPTYRAASTWGITALTVPIAVARPALRLVK